MGLKALPLLAMVFLVLVAGCHPSGTTEKNSTEKKVGAGPNPGSAQGPVKPDNGVSGSHAFVPFADKPPLGTPVETH